MVQRAWGWALPNFLPTLALMISVFAADALEPVPESATYVRKNFFYLAAGLSTFYAAATLISLLAQPIVALVFDTPDLVATRLELLEMSNLWLAPLQGLSIGSLGVLFFLKVGKGKSQ